MSHGRTIRGPMQWVDVRAELHRMTIESKLFMIATQKDQPDFQKDRFGRQIPRAPKKTPL